MGFERFLECHIRDIFACNSVGDIVNLSQISLQSYAALSQDVLGIFRDQEYSLKNYWTNIRVAVEVEDALIACARCGVSCFPESEEEEEEEGDCER